MILIGCGGVGSAVLELIPICKLLPKNFTNELTIIEPREISHLTFLHKYKYKHIQIEIIKENIDNILNSILKKNDVIFDCSVNVDALAIMAIAHKIGALYINCSMEDWETPDAGHINSKPKALLHRSLCYRIWQAHTIFSTGPTMLADQGMNPGIISLFALRGMEDMARAVNNGEAIQAMQNGDYAKASEILGIRTIHITERDTQTLKKARPVGDFCNTWSSAGLIAEALDPIQLGNGTHEIKSAKSLHATDFLNMRIIPHRGMEVSAWSYSPSRTGIGGPYHGFLIPHGEANTLSTCLSSKNYRPSVYFVYQPCPFARDSLDEIRRSRYKLPKKECIKVAMPLPALKGGYDAVGALLWSDRYPAWWSGTILDCTDMAPLGIKYSGPTTIQVAIAIISAIKWMLVNPSVGFITPEDLPYSQILKDCEPYLGRIYSGFIPNSFYPYSLRLNSFTTAKPKKNVKWLIRKPKVLKFKL